MAKENLNETFSKLVSAANKAIKDVIETVGDAVEESPVVKKQSWEELAARGQRIATKWADGKGEKDTSGPIETLRSNIESQLESMPRRARERTFQTLSNLAGVVDDLTNLGHYRDPAPEHGATLSGHGLRPVHGPMSIRRAAGTSGSAESPFGSYRRVVRERRYNEL